MKTNPSGIVRKAESMSEEIRKLKKELEQAKAAAAGSRLRDMIDQAVSIGEIRLITGMLEHATINDLRGLSDQVREQEKRVVLVLAAVEEEKATLMVSLTDDLLDKGYHAGALIKEIARAAGGSGGGKADMAQAGIKDPSRVGEAFGRAKALLEEN